MRSTYIVLAVLLGFTCLGLVIFAAMQLNTGAVDPGFATLVLAIFPGAGAYLFYRLLRKSS